MQTLEWGRVLETEKIENKRHSARALEAATFFSAAHTWLGLFLATYIATTGWESDRVGVALTLMDIVTMLVQGSLARATRPGNALSTTVGSKSFQASQFRISFLSLDAVASGAYLLLLSPFLETLHKTKSTEESPQGAAA